jgi:hypothetical protein
MSASPMSYQLCFTFNATDSPNKGLVKSGFWDPWASVFVNRREDVERGKNSRYGEM